MSWMSAVNAASSALGSYQSRREALLRGIQYNAFDDTYMLDGRKIDGGEWSRICRQREMLARSQPESTTRLNDLANNSIRSHFGIATLNQSGGSNTVINGAFHEQAKAAESNRAQPRARRDDQVAREAPRTLRQESAERKRIREVLYGHTWWTTRSPLTPITNWVRRALVRWAWKARRRMDWQTTHRSTT